MRPNSFIFFWATPSLRLIVGSGRPAFPEMIPLLALSFGIQVIAALHLQSALQAGRFNIALFTGTFMAKYML